LLATLEGLPKKPKEPYRECPEAAYADLVLATEDARAWDMLEKVAKRSVVGLRMEFLSRMNYIDLGDQRCIERLKFLASFLGDTDIPDVAVDPEMFKGPHAGFTFRSLAVRDLAAMEIASILKMPDQPDSDWTAEQWEKLRARVK